MGIIACCTGVILLLSGIVQMALYGYNLSLLAVGIYILRLNRFKYINVTYSFYRALTKKRKCRVLPVRSIVVSPKTDTKTIIYRLGWDYYLNVMIRGENGEIFTISEDKFIGFIMKKGINCEISNIFLENSA
jgi:hypothetical protein